MGDWNAINSQIPYQLMGGKGGGDDCNCDGANVGSGPGEVFRDKTGNTLNFRTLKSADDSLNIVTAGDEIDLQVNPENLPGCMPLLTGIGGLIGARFTAEVTVQNGAEADQRGIYLGGIFAGLKNLVSDDTDDITLLVVEDPSDANVHLRIAYRNNADSPYGRLVFVQNSNEVYSIPAQIDSHPTLVAAVIAPAGDTETLGMVVGSSVIGEVPVKDFDWPSSATMRVRVGQSVGGGQTVRDFHTGGVFMGVPPLPLPSPDIVALALNDVALTGRLEAINAALISAQAWVANALKDDPSLTPWPELNGGTGLARTTGEAPQYALNCTPAWAPAQMPAGGENLADGFEVYQKEASFPGHLKFRTLVGSSSINIQQDDTTLFFEANLPPAVTDLIEIGYDQWNGGNWVLPKNNADPVIVPNQLETSIGVSENFVIEAGGAGGRAQFQGQGPKNVRISMSFTVIRPPEVSLDARGQFFIGLKVPPNPDFEVLPNSQQWKRFNIIDCDDVIHLEALVEMEDETSIALMATSDAGALGSGLGIQLKGYTLTIVEV